MLNSDDTTINSIFENDEDQILNEITQLSAEVNKIESISGRSLHTIKMRIEIEKLEDQLS